MTLDASVLQISVQEQERWRRLMNVIVPASVVRTEEHKAAQQLASRARLKGFRKGKVPTRMIESRFSGALRQEALDRLIGDAYRRALASENLQPISEGQVERVDYQPEADLSFSIAFDVRPDFSLTKLGGFTVERPTPRVGAEHVDEILARLQEQAGVWKPAEAGRPEDKDLVSVEIARLGEDPEAQGRSYDFVLGRGDAIADIEAAIETLEPGGSGEFDVTFPDDFPDESRRGVTERIRIKLTRRRTLELPDLDDDLARQVGDFDTLEDLRANIRKDVERDADEQAESVVRGRLLELLLEANPFDVPVSMVDRYAEAIVGEESGVPADKMTEIRDQIRPEAERVVKRILLIERIAETQSLGATEEDIDERIEQIAETSGANPAKVYADLQKAGRIETLERELTERKVFDFLKGQSAITEAPAA